MKKALVVMLLLVAAFAAGLYTSPHLETGPGEGNDSPAVEREILYWVAPMDPNFRRDEPGKSPMGMDLVPVYADETDDEAVNIAPHVVNNLGVRTAEAEVRPLWRRIEATGYVGFDETRISHINTRAQGWITRLMVEAEGEKVAKGDLLFEFYSPDLLNAQKEYLSALRRDRTALRDGAREKLLALGMIPAQVEALARNGVADDSIRIVAPQDGVVTSLEVREGMFVQPNTPIMSLADLSSVWLQAKVFESQADWVAEGQSATATLEYMPGTEFTGRVDYVYPVLDPETRTLRLRLRFDNPDRRLKPNMYARVTIYGRLKPNALVVPRDALIPAPGYDRLVVARGEGSFEVREVMTGLESGQFVEVLAGLDEGERVVTSAQFLIDSEASASGSIRRLDASRPAVEQRSLERVFVSGWVDEIDRDNRRVRISHGPIDELGWPAMTMVFDALPGVELATIAAGQDVRFGLLQRAGGEYVLENIHTAGAAAGAPESVNPADYIEETTAEGHAHHPSHGEAQNEPSPRPVMASGVVVAVMPEEGSVRLTHDPIPSLEWPAMTMNFAVAPDVPLAELEPGAAVHFTMREAASDGWVIEHIHVMSSPVLEQHDD